LILALASTGLLGDEGRIPIFQPTTITQPGHYVLTRDVSSSSVPVLQIQASNVTLDLNGRTVSSSATSGTGTINIADGSMDVTILNGRVTGGPSGIRYFSSAVPTRLRIEGIDLRPAVHGIEIYGAAFVDVIKCRVFGPYLGQGISVSNTDGSFGGHFLNNTVEGAGQAAFFLNGVSESEIRGNVVRNYGVSTFGWGMFIQVGNNPSGQTGGNVIEGNMIRGGGGDDVGLEISAAFPATSDRNLIKGNVITNPGHLGINVITTGNLISGNIISGASGGTLNHGLFIQVGTNNLIEYNQVQGNSGCGINFVNAGSHAYRQNMLRGNSGGAVCGSANTDAGGNIL
jgi:parallel beta helix pectate lyase-like protein